MQLLFFTLGQRLGHCRYPYFAHQVGCCLWRELDLPSGSRPVHRPDLRWNAAPGWSGCDALSGERAARRGHRCHDGSRNRAFELYFRQWSALVASLEKMLTEFEARPQLDQSGSMKSLSEIQIVSSYISSPNGSCKITLSGDLSLDVFSLYFLERCTRTKVSIY